MKIAIGIIISALVVACVILYCCVIISSDTDDRNKKIWERFKGLDKRGW